MFVASTYPTPSIFLLPVLSPTAKRLKTAVSAQLRPRTTTTTGKDDDDEFNQHNNVGSIGHAVFTASSKPVKKNQSPVIKESQQLLSGSDVLRALSKAAAEKAKPKKKNQKGTQSGSSSSTTTTGASRDGKIIRGGGTKTVPDVQPLRLKEEWGIRLEQLQNRLDDLKLETL